MVSSSTDRKRGHVLNSLVHTVSFEPLQATRRRFVPSPLVWSLWSSTEGHYCDTEAFSTEGSTVHGRTPAMHQNEKQHTKEQPISQS